MLLLLLLHLQLLLEDMMKGLVMQQRNSEVPLSASEADTQVEGFRRIESDEVVVVVDFAWFIEGILLDGMNSR